MILPTRNHILLPIGRAPLHSLQPQRTSGDVVPNCLRSKSTGSSLSKDPPSTWLWSTSPSASASPLNPLISHTSGTFTPAIYGSQVARQKPRSLSEATMTPTRNSNIQLLVNLVDYSDEDESEYRFLVAGKYVKYVTVDPGVLPKDDRTFGPILLPSLPSSPPGDWNEGHISKGPRTGRPVFSHYTRSDLPGVPIHGITRRSIIWSSGSSIVSVRTFTWLRIRILTRHWLPSLPSSPGRCHTSRPNICV